MLVSQSVLHGLKASYAPAKAAVKGYIRDAHGKGAGEKVFQDENLASFCIMVIKSSRRGTHLIFR